MNQKNQKWLCALLIGLNLAFIWGNSVLPGDDSGAMSGWLLRLLGFLPNSEQAHTILRKIAHFSEFACLGLLMGWMRILVKDKPALSLLGCGLAAACVDETIQYFVPGRASSLIDVWIDAAGFATGLMILAIGYTILKRKYLTEETDL